MSHLAGSAPSPPSSKPPIRAYESKALTSVLALTTGSAGASCSHFSDRLLDFTSKEICPRCWSVNGEFSSAPYERMSVIHRFLQVARANGGNASHFPPSVNQRFTSKLNLLPPSPGSLTTCKAFHFHNLMGPSLLSYGIIRTEISPSFIHLTKAYRAPPVHRRGSGEMPQWRDLPMTPSLLVVEQALEPEMCW